MNYIINFCIFILLFFSELNGTGILEFRQVYLEGKLKQPPIFFQENLDEDEKILKDLTLFEFYLDKNDIQTAENYALALLDFYPISQLVNCRLGEHYFLLQNYEKAKEYFIKCVNNDSQFHEARRYLAKICLNLKDYKTAYKNYNILSWFRPDKDVLKKIEYLSNHINCAYQIESSKKNKFSEVFISSFEVAVPEINVGVSTHDNGKILQIDCIRFFSKCDFEIYNDKEEKVLECEGGENNEWTVVYRTKLRKFGIISPPLKKEYRINSKFIIIEPKISSNTFLITEYKWFKNQFPQNVEYRGKIVIRHLKDQIVVINRVKLDEYLYSVVAKEIGADKPQEALKTQAVVARTLVLYRAQNKAHKYFDVCKGQHCQVYDGIKCEKENIINAVNETLGEVVINNGKLINIFFQANCGGIFSHHFFDKNSIKPDFSYDYEEIDMSKDTKKLISWYLFPPDLYCKPSDLIHPGFSRWLRVVRKDELSKYLNEKYRIGNLKDIKIIERKSNGYITKLKLVGTKKSATLKYEHLIRGITPLGNLRSASFYLEYNKNDNVYYFWGAGWGHGVGMCQSGVSNLAQQGKNYVDIIKHYYPNTEIKKIY